MAVAGSSSAGRAWACRQLRRSNVRNGAVAACQIAAFEVLQALARAEIREGNQRGLVALIALAKPNLVAAEHVLAENGRVVRGEDKLSVAFQRWIVKPLHEMPHEHWVQVVVQLIDHDNVVVSNGPASASILLGAQHDGDRGMEGS